MANNPENKKNETAPEPPSAPAVEGIKKKKKII